jgi:hypothetical protein
MSIHKLLTLLKRLENDNSIEQVDYLEESIPIVNEIVQLANELLITEKGQCNYNNMAILESNNFNIFPLEVDSFGWLVAAIQTIKGIIVYG